MKLEFSPSPLGRADASGSLQRRLEGFAAASIRRQPWHAHRGGARRHDASESRGPAIASPRPTPPFSRLGPPPPDRPVETASAARFPARRGHHRRTRITTVSGRRASSTSMAVPGSCTGSRFAPRFPPRGAAVPHRPSSGPVRRFVIPTASTPATPPRCGNHLRVSAGTVGLSITAVLREPGSPSARVTCSSSLTSVERRSTSFVMRSNGACATSRAYAQFHRHNRSPSAAIVMLARDVLYTAAARSSDSVSIRPAIRSNASVDVAQFRHAGRKLLRAVNCRRVRSAPPLHAARAWTQPAARQ